MPATRAVVVERFGGPGVLTPRDGVEAREPGPGEVLVRVRAAGVNPVDTYIREGWYAGAAVPYVPGLDGSGEIVAVGPGVSAGWGIGARVWFCARGAGAYAGLACLPASAVWPLADGLSFEAGACLGVPFLTAWRAVVQLGGMRAGETVLVHGASGGVGTAAAQIAAWLGGRVLGTAGTEAGRDLARRCGCEAVFDHGSTAYEAEIAEAAGPGGVGLVVEMLANANLVRDLRLVGRGGRVVVVGSRGEATIDPRAAMGKDAAVLGMSLMNASAAELDAAAAGVNAGVRLGRLRPEVREVVPLDEAGRAHELVMSPGALGCVVLGV